VKVHLDSDIKIIGEAFIMLPTMGVSSEWCENVNVEDMAKTQCVALLSKKATKKVEKTIHFQTNLVQGSSNNLSCNTTGIE